MKKEEKTIHPEEKEVSLDDLMQIRGGWIEEEGELEEEEKEEIIEEVAE